MAHESPQWKRTFVLGSDEFLGLTYWDKEELEMNIPEVEAATRAAMLWQPLIREGNQLLQCAGMEADADFFKVLPEYRLVEGSAEDFVGKEDILISESLARKIAVDGDNLIGKVIKVDDSDRTIKGVFADFDGTFFMPYDIITHISGTWAAEQERNFGSIGNYTTWFRVREDADPDDVRAKVKALLLADLLVPMMNSLVSTADPDEMMLGMGDTSVSLSFMMTPGYFLAYIAGILLLGTLCGLL